MRSYTKLEDVQLGDIVVITMDDSFLNGLIGEVTYKGHILCSIQYGSDKRDHYALFPYEFEVIGDVR